MQGLSGDCGAHASSTLKNHNRPNWANRLSFSLLEISHRSTLILPSWFLWPISFSKCLASDLWVLNLLLVLKLGINKKISGLSLSDPHRQFFIQSFLWACRGQDFNIYGRSSSLKYEICLMNKRAKFHPNYTHDYQLNFRELVWWKRVQQLVWVSNWDFQQLLLKIFRSLSCLIINLTEIQEHLVLNTKQCLGPLPYGPNGPPSEKGLVICDSSPPNQSQLQN